MSAREPRFPKVDYLQLHQEGRQDPSSSEDEEISGKFEHTHSKSRSKSRGDKYTIPTTVTFNEDTIVKETPLHTTVEFDQNTVLSEHDVEHDSLMTVDLHKFKNARTGEIDLDQGVIPETQSDNMASPQNLLSELTDAEMQVKRAQLDEEQKELEERACRITEEAKLEAKERQLVIMRKQVEALLQAKKEASESPVALCPDIIEGDETATQLANMIELLKKEAIEREKIKEIEKKKQEEFELEQERQRILEEERRKEKERLEKEEEERRRKEDEEKKRQEEEIKTKTDEDDNQSQSNEDKITEIMEWMRTQKEQQQQSEMEKQKIKELQAQIDAMTKSGNKVPCAVTGVNMFAGLENLQGQGESSTRIDLAAKAQAAMVAAHTEKKRKIGDEEGDTDGESDNSINSQTSGKHKHRKLKSGISVKSGQKVRFEIEWAHHWLGKEFDANPVAFNQMKIGHYLMGETDIILNS